MASFLQSGSYIVQPRDNPKLAYLSGGLEWPCRTEPKYGVANWHAGVFSDKGFAERAAAILAAVTGHSHVVRPAPLHLRA